MLNLLEDNASINALFDIKNSDSLTMELLCKEVALHSDLVKSRITVGTWSISGIEFSASMCAGVLSFSSLFFFFFLLFAFN